MRAIGSKCGFIHFAEEAIGILGGHFSTRANGFVTSHGGDDVVANLLELRGAALFGQVGECVPQQREVVVVFENCGDRANGEL